MLNEKDTGHRAIKLQKSHTILVVDDSTDMLELRKTILEMDGFNVLTAQSGGLALEVLARGNKPDLILLDVRMDDMSGPELLDILNDQNPDLINNIPIVFLTALNEVPKSKAAGFISKTTDLDKFLQAVRNFIKMEPINSQFRH